MEVNADPAIVRSGGVTARVVPRDFVWTDLSHTAEVFSPGDVDLFFIKDVKGQTAHVTLDQHPDVQGALVAIENSTGAVKALAGGDDFEERKYNRARQAERQVGASFQVSGYAPAVPDRMSPLDRSLDSPLCSMTSSGELTPHHFVNPFAA